MLPEPDLRIAAVGVEGTFTDITETTEGAEIRQKSLAAWEKGTARERFAGDLAKEVDWAGEVEIDIIWDCIIIWSREF